MSRKSNIQEKPIEFLINSIKEKLHGTDVPKCCWLIGAGCSFRSGIPTGAQLIELLKMEVFKKEYITSNVTFSIDPPFDYAKYEEAFQKYIRDENLTNKYEQFTQKHEYRIREEVDMLDERNIITLIPPNQRSKHTNDSERKKENKEKFEGIKKQIYKDYEYGYYFRQYSESARERQILVEKVIEDKPTKYGYVCLANLIHNNNARTVFTTNFDDLLNEALMAYFFKHAKVLAHSELSSYIDYRGKTPHIIKLHGDYMFSNIRNTSDEINNLSNTLSEKLCDALRDGFGLVVLGYNGADYSIMNKLEETKEKCGGSPFPIIWCDRKAPHELHWRVQHLLKETANAFYIRIAGFDALMATLETTLGLVKVNMVERAKTMQADLKSFYDDVLKEPEITGDVKVQLEKKRNFDQVFNEAYIEKDLDKKAELYKEAIELNPMSSIAYNNWGATFLRLWEAENNEAFLSEAIDKLRKAIEIQPKYTLAFNNLGWALGELGAKSNNKTFLLEAIDKFKKAIEVRPGYLRAFGNWGNVILHLWKIQRDDDLLLEAIDKLEKARSYGYYNLSSIYSLLGKRVKALFYLEKALIRKSKEKKKMEVMNNENFKNISHLPAFKGLLNRYCTE